MRFVCIDFQWRPIWDHLVSLLESCLALDSQLLSYKSRFTARNVSIVCRLRSTICCCQLRPLAFMHVFRVGFQTSHTLYYLREFIQFTANPILFKIVGLHCKLYLLTLRYFFFHYFFKISNESKCEGILNQISSYIKIQRSKVLFFLMNWNEYYFFGRIISFFNFRKNLIQNRFNWCYKYHSFQQLFSKTNLTSLQQFFFVRISIRFQRDLK